MWRFAGPHAAQLPPKAACNVDGRIVCGQAGRGRAQSSVKFVERKPSRQASPVELLCRSTKPITDRGTGETIQSYWEEEKQEKEQEEETGAEAHERVPPTSA